MIDIESPDCFVTALILLYVLFASAAVIGLI
jgi:hypothetical protein